MKFRISMVALGAALLSAPAAFAQDTTTQATPAVTDAEVAQFATAALAVDKVHKDTMIAEADKNARMVEAIAASGLEPARFNEISQAMRADPAINQRIQAAAARQAATAAPAPR